jgi:4-hydroxy-tetrahydrodipicolinate synthase
MKEYVDNCIKQDKKAKELYKAYYSLFANLHIQTSPLPVKTFLSNKEIIKAEFRLPLCRMDLNEKEEFLRLVGKIGI